MNEATFQSCVRLLTNSAIIDCRVYNIGKYMGRSATNIRAVHAVVDHVLDLMDIPPKSERYNRQPYFDLWWKSPFGLTLENDLNFIGNQNLDKKEVKNITDRSAKWMNDCLELFKKDFPETARMKARLIRGLAASPDHETPLQAMHRLRAAEENRAEAVRRNQPDFNVPDPENARMRARENQAGGGPAISPALRRMLESENKRLTRRRMQAAREEEDDEPPLRPVPATAAHPASLRTNNRTLNPALAVRIRAANARRTPPAPIDLPEPEM